jgi:hypothetical protein
MGATSDDLMDIARAGAERIDLPDEHLRYPSFSDIEEQCATEYDELLNVLHEDELFQPVDVQRQQELVDKLKALLGAQQEDLSRIWWTTRRGISGCIQEAAFHLGMAVGLRLAEGYRH